MILVAGGQLDPNIGALLKRMLSRKTEFVDLLVGPELLPTIDICIGEDSFYLDGVKVSPSACFVRHDVFMFINNRSTNVSAAALNWYYTVRGWLQCCENVRCFNRESAYSENNKIRNLALAQEVGLSVPITRVTNQIENLGDAPSGSQIKKPVAGGAFTTLVGPNSSTQSPELLRYPHFVQQKLDRPELRIYVIGSRVFGFGLASEDLDYREKQNAKITMTEVPNELIEPLNRLCGLLGLNFGAADFMRNTTTDRWTFLEINSQPMFAAFDNVAAGKLCDAIIDYLES